MKLRMQESQGHTVLWTTPCIVFLPVDCSDVSEELPIGTLKCQICQALAFKGTWL